jgi:hypothetical protein
MLSHAEVYNALADKKKSVAKGQGLSTPMYGELVKGMDREDGSGKTASPPTFFYLKLSIKNNEEKEC